MEKNEGMERQGIVEKGWEGRASLGRGRNGTEGREGGSGRDRKRREEQIKHKGIRLCKVDCGK